MNETPFLTERLEVTVSETGTLRDVPEATDGYVQERVTEPVYPHRKRGVSELRGFYLHPHAAHQPQNPQSEDAYYAEAVLWAAENGIAFGTAEATFSPENGCTRSQSVTFLYRAVTAE